MEKLDKHATLEERRLWVHQFIMEHYNKALTIPDKEWLDKMFCSRPCQGGKK
jgi:hypothetical protein